MRPHKWIQQGHKHNTWLTDKNLLFKHILAAKISKIKIQFKNPFTIASGDTSH